MQIKRIFWTIFKKNCYLLFCTPLSLILNLSTIAVLFLIACLPTYAIDEHNLFLRDQSQATILFMSSISCLFCTLKVITEDLTLNTATITLSRPVNGFIYCLSAMASLVFYTTVMQILFQTSYLWLSEIASDNYHLHLGSFALFISFVCLALLIPAIKQYFFGGRYLFIANLSLIGAMIGGLFIRILFAKVGSIDFVALQSFPMIGFASMVFTFFLIPLSLIYKNSSVVIWGTFIFFVGTISDYFFTQALQIFPFLKPFNALVPNWQIFWVVEHLNKGYDIALSYFVNCFIHTALIGVLALIISTFILKKIEIAR